jgi:ribosome biogenesis GTPase
MTKRKLSKLQQRRKLQKITQHIDRAAQPGLVLANYGDQAEVEIAQHQVIRCHLRRNLGGVVCGDHIVWETDEHGNSVIVARHPRKTQLSKYNALGKQIKTVAANIQQMVIVIANQPTPSYFLLDSYLVAAHANQLTPIILLNKADLPAQTQIDFSIYQQLGYQTLTTSAYKDIGMQQLSSMLADHANLFVGQSGVGKSSLTKYLLPEEKIAVQSLSKDKLTGVHTTTLTRLYHLPQGGYLLDSPGVSEFNLSHLTEEVIFAAFTDLNAYQGQCKFRDCSHTVEPGCAILQAVAAGKIAASRMESFLRLRAAISTN